MRNKNAQNNGKVKKGKKPKTLPYRIHDNPDPQKLETLREFVVKLKITRLKMKNVRKKLIYVTKLKASLHKSMEC